LGKKKEKKKKKIEAANTFGSQMERFPIPSNFN